MRRPDAKLRSRERPRLTILGVMGGSAAEDEDRDWRLAGTLPDTDDHRALHAVVERVRDEQLLRDARASVGDEVVVTHDGSRVFAYAATRSAIEQARTAIEAALEQHGLHATFSLTHYSDVLDEWVDPDTPPPEAVVRAATSTETRTIVATVGRMVRGEFEESMRNWADQLGLRCEIVEHPHLLNSQVAFTVTGPSRKVDEFASGLAAEQRQTIRTERQVMLSPLVGGAGESILASLRIDVAVTRPMRGDPPRDAQLANPARGGLVGRRSGRRSASGPRSRTLRRPTGPRALDDFPRNRREPHRSILGATMGGGSCACCVGGEVERRPRSSADSLGPPGAPAAGPAIAPARHSRATSSDTASDTDARRCRRAGGDVDRSEARIDSPSAPEAKRGSTRRQTSAADPFRDRRRPGHPQRGQRAHAREAPHLQAPAHVPLAAVPHGEPEQLVSGPVHLDSSGSLCSRHAILDCSENSSMKPGEAVCENSPPDSENDASCAS